MRISSALAAALLLAPGLAGCGATTSPTPLAPSGPVVSLPPPPQELVRGSITDTASRQVAGVRVEVLDGPQAGSSAVTDAAGAFVFAGAFDDAVRFRASKEGYVDAVQTSRPPACPTCARWIHFDLESPSAPSFDLSGQYDLTFTAAESCAAIPAELRSRTYVASVTRDASSRWRYVVSVTGASIVHGHSWEGIGLGTTENHATVSLGNYHGDPGLLEQVDGDSYLSFDGEASMVTGSTWPPSLSGALDGFIDYCVLPPGSGSPVSTGRFVCGAGPSSVSGTRSSCFAVNHRLTLTRR